MYAKYRLLTLQIAILSAISLWVFVCPALALPLDEVELELNIGEQKVIPSDGVRSYSEGTPGVIDVRLTKDATQFVVVGMRPGRTTLLFIMLDGNQRNYHVTVIDPNRAVSEKVEVKLRPNQVTAEDNIRLDFYFVQISKSYQHQLGLSWPGTLGNIGINASFDMISGSFSEATAVVTGQVLPSLDLAQTAGWAKLMRQAAVITVNGRDADYAGGGEVNIAIQGSFAAEIRQIRYGSTIKVRPRYDRESGRIELTIQAEVTDLTEATGGGVPGRVTSNLNTVVNLELGQSLALAGLTAHSMGRAHTGLPGLSQIPILGVFFGSHSERDQEVENVVFIVPSVVDAVSLQARERIREAMRVYENYTGNTDKIDFMESKKNLGTSRRN